LGTSKTPDAPNIIVGKEGILKLLLNLNPHKAMGPDQLSTRFLREMATSTARTARFSKKSLRSDVGEIKKMSEKLKKKSVLTPRNVREKSNTVIYYKTPTKHRH
jgi:hypothetical protein